jgi:hypothetical protein
MGSGAGRVSAQDPAGQPHGEALPSSAASAGEDAQSLATDSHTALRQLGHTRSLDLPETRLLADLYSVWYDFDLAVTCLDRLIQLLSVETSEPDPILQHAMWTTAVVHYTRCFTSGQRQRVLTSATISRHLPQQSELHQWLMDLRNKHLAHDESLAWQFNGVVNVWEMPDGRRLAQAGASAVTLIAVDPQLATAAREHMVTVGDLLKDRIEKARRRCSEAIAKMPLDEVLTLPDVDLKVPTTPETVLPRGPGSSARRKRRRR